MNESSVHGEDRRWRAVLERDRGYDGQFVYAVRTTGIYCRPSCPSRRPRRERVVFLSPEAAARQTAYRPCRRCRPELPPGADPGAELAARACALIDAAEEEAPTLRRLGEALGVSPGHVQRTFTAAMGVSPRAYAEQRRLERLKRALSAGAPVTTALYDAGFGSSSRLYERADERLGMTPATYRRGGLDMHIAYTIVPCRLGLLLVAGTERGICAVSLGDDRAALEAGLSGEYPRADRLRDDGALREWVTAILAHLEGEPLSPALPLDLQATAFQWQVWGALQRIPYGDSRSYGEIARAIGQPGAVRAVARACATNPAALVIPCHRAVRADGTASGYRWGPARKEALLAREREQSGPAAPPLAELPAGALS